jgi:hypothetical protein
MTHLSKCLGLALVILAAAAACTGGSTPLPPCALPELQPVFFMSYPSPGASAVPDNLGSIVFDGYPTSSNFRLTTGTQTIALGTLEPVPTPSGVPAGALSQWFAPLPAPLSPKTTYTVFSTWSVSGSSNCAGQTGTYVFGSFTTQ